MMNELILAFSPNYNLFQGKEHIILHNEEHQVLLDGSAAVWLAGVLKNGGLSQQKLRRLAAASGLASQVNAIVEDLLQDCVMIQHCTNQTPESVFAWARMRIPFPQIASTLSNKSVRLIPLGTHEVDFKEPLASVGIKSDKKSDLFPIVITDCLLRTEIGDHQKEFAEAELPWMLVHLSGPVISWSCFVPGVTACWRCLYRRLLLHPLHQWMARPAHGGAVSQAMPANNRAIATQFISSAVLSLLVTGTDDLSAAALHKLNTVSLSSSVHPIQKLAACNGCSMRGENVLERQEKPSARLLADPVTGVVSSLRPLVGLKGDYVHTWISNHTLSYNIKNLHQLNQNLRAHSTGRGATAEAAKTSALYEAVERMSGIWRPDIETIEARPEALANDALLPDELLLYGRDQYKERVAWNGETEFEVLMVPESYNPSNRLAWVQARELNEEREVYLPAAYAYYDFSGPGAQFCVASSNGCAAGSSLEGAIKSGLYELVERDAVSIWWYSQLQRPRLDLEGVNDPYVSDVVAAHKDLGRLCWVLDVTHNLGIPVFAALSRNEKGDEPNWLIGFGCHTEPLRALKSALSEMNQMLPLILEGRPMPALWTLPEKATLPATKFLYPKETAPVALSNACSNKDSVASIAGALNQQGLSAYYINQTHPDIGVDVVRVVSPGLYHFWRRLGGERLYRVPMESGWTDAPLSAHLLNPYSIVL